jgi:hypothetical protein
MNPIIPTGLALGWVIEASGAWCVGRLPLTAQSHRRGENEPQPVFLAVSIRYHDSGPFTETDSLASGELWHAKPSGSTQYWQAATEQDGGGGILTMSYGGNADPSGIQVTFLDQTGSKSVKAVIAFTVPVSRIIPNIITKMNLPATSPDGQPMSYALDHKEGGRRLLENWTLVEAGIQNGDHLIVYPEVVAGRG